MATVPTVPDWTAGQRVLASQLQQLTTAARFAQNPPLAVLYQTVAQTLTTGTPAPVTYDSEQVDSVGGHSTVTNTSRYTAQYTGYYFVHLNNLFVSNATGGRLAQVYKNGTALTTSFTVIPAAPTFYAAMGIESSTWVQLNVGDYVEGFASQNSGGDLDTYVAAGAGSSMEVFWGHA